MPLGRESKLKLATCDVRLQQLITALAADVDAGLVPFVSDIKVDCGYRGKAEQDAAFARRTSKLLYPHSKHNRIPAMAVDVLPYPVDFPSWETDKRPQESLRAHTLALASRLGIRLRVISWDLPHYELL